MFFFYAFNLHGQILRQLCLSKEQFQVPILPYFGRHSTLKSDNSDGRKGNNNCLQSCSSLGLNSTFSGRSNPFVDMVTVLVTPQLQVIK